MSAKRRLRLPAALDAVMVQMETNTPSRLASQGGFDGELFADQHLAAEGWSTQTGGILRLRDNKANRHGRR